MPALKSICIFCASSPGSDPRYRAAAEKVGEKLGSRGVTTVYGGGRVGLMGIVADAALAAGGKVIGVIPAAMVQAERGHTGLTALHVVDTMHQRKAMLADLSDGFIALPGGYGTLDELFEAITWAQIGVHAKPVGVLNVGGFYDSLLGFLDGAVEAGFIQPRFRAALLVDDDIERLLQRMSEYQAPRGSGFARPADR